MKNVDVGHAAAYAHEGLSNFSLFFSKNNVVGSTSVFAAAIKNKVKRIYIVHQWLVMDQLNLLFQRKMSQIL